MIKICKIPHIHETTDRWGQPTGGYAVMDIKGEIDALVWQDVKLFEEYYDLDEGKKELEKVKNMLAAGSQVSQLDMPLMQRLIKRAGGQIWQMNLRTNVIDDETVDYIRTYAVFGEKTLYEWTPEHDKKVVELVAEVNRMNTRRKIENE